MNSKELKIAIEKKRNPEGYLLIVLEEMQKTIDSTLQKVVDQQKEIDSLTKTIEENVKKIDQEGIIKEVSKKIPDLASLANVVIEEVNKNMPKDGYTPVKGVDYFDGEDGDTPEIDIDAIATLAASKIEPTIVPETELPNEETPETIVEKINTQKSAVDISVIKDLKGILDTIQKNIRSIAGKSSKGFMRGGGDVVLAGTGISITQTNSHGRKTINNTSTGGFTTLAASETPNGATVVFTFLTATAQPNFIISDNVWLKPVSAVGTVNWTWNSITKKATLAIPPLDDILGIV